MHEFKLYYFNRCRNFGDELNRAILGYLGVDYCCTSVDEANLLAIGSLLSPSTGLVTDAKPFSSSYDQYMDVWGTGFIQEKNYEKEFFIKKVNIHALRGKFSKERCENILGHALEGIALGDPGLLVSRAIPVNNVKKYDVGIIPHYVDKNSDLIHKIKLKNKNFKIIDVQDDPPKICREIGECRMILSSAMHGLIAADSYGVPNRWVKFSDEIIGGNYKFHDYYSAFDIEGLEPVDLRQRTISDQDIDQFILNYLIRKNDVERICDDLEKAFPRKKDLAILVSQSLLDQIESEKKKSRADNQQAIDYFDSAARNLYDNNFQKAEENILQYKSMIKYESFPRYDKRFLKDPKLSVIIVGYQTGDNLLDCVESLINNNDGYYDIIVVDNGGNEKVVEKLLGFRLLYISSPHNFGPSEGRNIGAHFAKGEIISFLDDDAIAGKDYVPSIIESFKNYNVIGLRGKILPKSTSSHHKNANHYDLGNNDLLIAYINTEGNSAFKKNEYLKLNGMNPLLFGHEGIDLSYRIEKAHNRKTILYSSGVVIYHDFASADFEFNLKERRHSVMMSYLNFLHPGIDGFITGANFSESCKPLNENISFSIIMPTYNRKYCIKNAIDSLLMQTYQRFELIIIDDGSTDGTDQFLQEMYAQEIINKKIKYIKLPTNKGTACARNIGISEAQYSWIGYLDTDNHMHNDFLETFANSIKNSAFEIHYAQARLLQSQTIIGRPFDFDELLQFNYIDLGALVHSCRLYKELGGFDVNLKRLIDWDLIIKYTERYPPKFIQKVLLDYDDNTESSRITNRESAHEAYKQVILNYYSRIPQRVFIEKYTGSTSRLKNEIAMLEEQIAALYNSTSWRITMPLRFIGHQVKRFRRVAELTKPAIQRGGGLNSTIRKAIRLYRREGIPGIKRGFRMVAASAYHRDGRAEQVPWKDAPTDESLAQMKAFIDHFDHKPLISVVMPTYNTKPEWLTETIETVRNQIYPYWELCIADGGSGKETIDCLSQWQKLDKRIKVVFLEENKGIAGNSIAAYALAHGDYIILLDHDDCLSRDALMEVVLCINKNIEVDFIYSDKAVFADETKEILAYHCLPGFSPDLLRSCNYASHLTAFSRFIIDEVGFLKPGYDGSQDYEFELRVIEKARKILNIPKVLYFSRAGQGSVALNPESKMYAYEAGRKAIEEHIKRIGYEGDVEFMRATYSYRIHYKIKGTPLVSIIIPNKDHKQDLKKCIDSIMTRSTYRHYEVIIVENNSETDDIFAYYDELKNVKEIKIIKITAKEFNFSAINNYAVQCAEGEHVLLLNNDTEVITPNWIEEMLAFSQREDVGAVGAKLYYADNRIQHAGLVIGFTQDIASHYHHGNDRRHTGYMHRLTMPQNYCAVTGACLMVKKRLYLEVGGMDEINFKIGLNDVDFCLKLREIGKINVWTPYAELYHYESASRGLDTTREKSARLQSESLFFRNKWKLYFEQGDPYHNAGIVF